MWWPEITLDVVQGDLKTLSSGGPIPSLDDDESVHCDWAVRNLEEKKKQSVFDKWDTVLNSMKASRNRLDSLRFDLCMSLFQAYMVNAALNHSVTAPMSPIDYCVKSRIHEAKFPSNSSDLKTYESIVSGIDAICFDVTDLVLDHAVVFPPDHLQDVKDVQRDTVCVNGEELQGAHVGYESIVKAVQELLPSKSETLAQSILSIGNRTFSGGVAFEKVMSVFTADEMVLVAPISNDAEPIDVVVLDDRILIRAHTRYSVTPENAGEMPPFKVDAFTMVDIPGLELVKSRGSVWLKKLLS